jgi:hypothetical protein
MANESWRLVESSVIDGANRWLGGEPVVRIEVGSLYFSELIVTKPDCERMSITLQHSKDSA